MGGDEIAAEHPQEMFTDIDKWIEHCNVQKESAAALITEHAAVDIAKTSSLLFRVADAALKDNPVESTCKEALSDEANLEIIEGMAGEFAFWKTVRDQGYKVPTDAAVHPVASRWQRKMKTDPAFKAKYMNTPVPQRETFRINWAKDMYNSCIKSREKIDVKKKDTVHDKCPGIGVTLDRQPTPSLRWALAGVLALRQRRRPLARHTQLLPDAFGETALGWQSGAASGDRYFLPLGRIAWLEGGLNKEEGMAAAVQNALSCIQAGPHCYKLHRGTKRIRWMYDQEHTTDIMSEEFRLSQKWENRQAKAPLALEGPTPEAGVGNNPRSSPSPPHPTSSSASSAS